MTLRSLLMGYARRLQLFLLLLLANATAILALGAGQRSPFLVSYMVGTAAIAAGMFVFLTLNRRYALPPHPPESLISETTMAERREIMLESQMRRLRTHVAAQWAVLVAVLLEGFYIFNRYWNAGQGAETAIVTDALASFVAVFIAGILGVVFVTLWRRRTEDARVGPSLPSGESN